SHDIAAFEKSAVVSVNRKPASRIAKGDRQQISPNITDAVGLFSADQPRRVILVAVLLDRQRSRIITALDTSSVHAEFALKAFAAFSRKRFAARILATQNGRPARDRLRPEAPVKNSSANGVASLFIKSYADIISHVHASAVKIRVRRRPTQSIRRALLLNDHVETPAFALAAGYFRVIR